MTNYIFSIKKITGLLAIYNDMGFLSSIGEVTPGPGDHTSWLPTGFGGAILGLLTGVEAANVNTSNHWLGNSPYPQVRVKPGSRAYVHKDEHVEEIDPPPENVLQLLIPFLGYDDKLKIDVVSYDPTKSGVTGNEGWQHYDDRQPGFF
jgi:hypothetical protein